jgi:hypothetical protein
LFENNSGFQFKLTVLESQAKRDRKSTANSGSQLGVAANSDQAREQESTKWKEEHWA